MDSKLKKKKEPVASLFPPAYNMHSSHHSRAAHGAISQGLGIDLAGTRLGGRFMLPQVAAKMTSSHKGHSGASWLPNPKLTWDYSAPSSDHTPSAIRK